MPARKVGKMSLKALAEAFARQDSMTPKERMQALKEGRQVDRPPYIPFASGFAAKVYGLDLGDYYRHPEQAFAAGLNMSKVFPWMNVKPKYGWANRGAWEFGGEITWPDNDRYAAPVSEKPVINDPNQVDDLPDPDPKTTGMNLLTGRFNEICRKNGMPAALPSGTPTSISGGVVGRDNFFRWIIKYPDAVHKLQRKVTDYILRTARLALRKYGPENCTASVGVPMESNQVMSPKTFATFCKPYIQEILGFYIDSGVKTGQVHLCGDHTANLPHWKDIPLSPRTSFSVGKEMDLEETGKALGSDYILAGNISTTLIHLGPPEALARDVIRCLEAGRKHSGGFILMPACGISPKTPLEHIEIIGRTLLQHGYYQAPA